MAQAARWAREGKYEEALSAYSAAVELAVNDIQRADALLGQAQILYMTRRYGEAALAYQRALKLDGVDEGQRIEAWRGVARVAALTHDRSGELEANEFLGRHRELSDAERSMALLRVGEILLAEGKQDRAAGVFREVVDCYPQHPAAKTARLRLLEIEAQRGHTAVVNEILTQARLHDSDQAEELHLRAAEIIADQGNTRRALEIVDQLLLFRPGSVAGWRQAWELHEQLGDAAQFIEEAVREVVAQPEKAEAMTVVAEAIAQRGASGDTDVALALYQQLVAAKPTSASILVSAADMALRAVRMELADLWSKKAVELAPQDSQAKVVRGRVLARLGRTDEALVLLKQASAYRPEDLSSAHRLSVLLATAQMENALPKVVEEVRSATGQPAALAPQLSKYYAGTGQWEAAITELILAAESQEASDGYAAVALRSWLSENSQREAVLEACNKLRKTQGLPESLGGPYVYGLLLEGRTTDALNVVEELPQEKRAQAALSAIQWLTLAGREDLARVLYRPVLTVRLEPTTEVQIALMVAEDLMMAGQVSDAARLLTEHRKPGMPDALSRVYDLTLAKALLSLGKITEAEAIAHRLAETQRATHANDVALVLAECALRRRDYAATQELAMAVLRDQELKVQTEPSLPVPPQVPELGPSEYAWPRRPAGGILGAGAQDVRGEALFLLAEATLRIGQIEKARRAFDRVVVEAPASGAATRAVQRLMMLGDLDRLDVEARNQFIEGLRELDEGELGRAGARLLQLVRECDGALEDDIRFLVAEATAMLQRDEAARQMEELAQDMPDAPLAPYALLRAAELRAPNAPAEALRLARALEEQFPSSALAPLAAALGNEIERAMAH